MGNLTCGDIIEIVATIATVGALIAAIRGNRIAIKQAQKDHAIALYDKRVEILKYFKYEINGMDALVEEVEKGYDWHIESFRMLFPAEIVSKYDKWDRFECLTGDEWSRREQLEQIIRDHTAKIEDGAEIKGSSYETWAKIFKLRECNDLKTIENSKEYLLGLNILGFDGNEFFDLLMKGATRFQQKNAMYREFICCVEDYIHQSVLNEKYLRRLGKREKRAKKKAKK